MEFSFAEARDRFQSTVEMAELLENERWHRIEVVGIRR